MKKLFSRLPKKLLAAAIVAGVVFGVVASGSALLGDGREVRPYTPGNTPGFDHVTFNSFTGVPNIGDERNFLTGKISEAPGGFYDPMNKVRAGDEILMRVYVHNNADESLNAGGKGVAKNTRVRVALPAGLAEDHKVNAFISADNATPKTIEDTLSMNGELPFQIEYVPGSARIKTNFIDTAISDSVVSSGVQIGDDKLDGNMNGCFKYVALVTLKVKVKSPSYTLDKKVRVNGTQTFTENVDVKPGQKVDFVLNFKNVGSTNLNNVVLGDRLPKGLTYVPGTTEWYSYHTGYKWTKVVNDNLFTGGLDTGSYGPNSSVFMRFTAVADATEDVKCDSKTFVNTGFAKPKDHGTVEDKASVKVTGDSKDCEEPVKPSYKCESLTVEKLGGRKVRATVVAPASNGAVFKSVKIDYGDGSTPKVTTNLVDEYEYKADGTFKIVATVTFTVNGEDKTVTSENCAKKVAFVPADKCPIPGKEHLPKNSPDCKEDVVPVTPVTPELPKTGAAGVVGVVAAVSAVATAAHNVLSRRSVR